MRTFLIGLCAFLCLNAQAGIDIYGVGTGRDGALTVSSTGLVVNVYTAVTADISAGSTSVSVNSTTGFAAGDLVMIWQATGYTGAVVGSASSIDLTASPVGRWELSRVTAVAANSLSLASSFSNSYTASVTQVIRVPEYTNVTINAGRSISAIAWNGSTGGIVAFLVNGTLTNNGSVDVRGRGFRAGQGVDDPTFSMGCGSLSEAGPMGAQRGEGIANLFYGVSSTGRGNYANGAGGGVCYLSGGAGGGNRGAGGQGGNSDLGTDGSRPVGGLGGASISASDYNHLFLGGGGAAGHSADVAGGAGGGVLFVRASALSGAGTYLASGSAASTSNFGGSGGGAGGTIYLRVVGAATAGNIQAIGGVGGSTNNFDVGPGGGGGGGWILFQKGSGTAAPTATSTVAGSSGSQPDPAAPGGSPYGATAGSSGLSTTLSGAMPLLAAPAILTPANGSSTTNVRPLVTGTAAANTSVDIYIDGALAGSVSVDAAGNFSFTPTSDFSIGSHTVNGYANSQGLYSTVSTTNTFTISSPATISTGSLPASSFCSGSAVSVPFTVSGTYTAGNVFTAQLSDAAGSFASPVSIGTLSGSTGGTITATLPAATASGSGYRVRVVASTPATTGTDNGSNISITTAPAASISYGAASYCLSGAAPVTFSGTTGGTFSSGAGLTIDATSGLVILAASSAGSYVVTYTVPATGACPAYSTTAAIVLNGAASVNQPLDATACAGATTTLATFTGTGGSYTWTNNNTGTGLAASGSGNIASFTATNGTTAPISSTVTVTPVGAGLQGFAYVPNNGANSVSVINIATSTTVATIPTAGEPYAVAVLPDRSKVFVSTVTGNRVEVITTATNSINQNSPFDAPHGLVASPDGSRVYVNGWTGSAVSYIPTATPTTSTFMTNVTNPEGMAVSPDGSKLYVASSTSPGKLAMINTATNAKTELTLGNNTYGVAVSPDGRYVYASNINSNTVSVIDAATFTLVTNISVGANPLGVALSSNGSKIYVANSGSNTVSVISAATNTVTATIPVGSYPLGLSVSPDGSRLFVTNQNSNSVSVINTATNAVLTTYPAGTKPTGLGNFLSATYTCDGTPKTFTFTVNPKPSWNNAGFSTSICNDQGIGLSISNGGNVPGADYSWTNSNPAIGTPATGSGSGLSFTGTNSGTTNISGLFTVTPSYTNNGFTCVGNSNTFTITVKPSPTVNTPGNQALCAGGSTAAVVFSGAVAGTTYSWTNNNSSIGLAASGTGDIASFTGVNAGSTAQTASISVSPTANSCPGTARSFSITVNPQPSATISYSGSPFCATGTATPTLTGTAGGTYSSTPGLSINSTTGVINLAASTAGTYTITYTIPPGNGCGLVSTTASVTIQSAASITQPGSQTVCGGSNTSAVTFSGTNGSGFTWTNNSPGIGLAASGTGNIPAFTATNNSAANVTATITVNMGANAGFCPAQPKTFTITVSPQPTASFSYSGSPYCSGPGTATPTFSGTSGGTYSSTTGLSINATTGAVDIAASTPGTYTITYTISASGVCPQVTSTATVTINPPVTATITASGPTTICTGGSVTLSAPATPGASYLWSNGATTSSITVSAAGTFTVAVTSNGCVANGGPVTVSVNPAPTVNAIASQNLCNGAPTTAVTFSGAVPGTVYGWTNNTTSIGLAASGSGDIASFPAVNNGTAPVTALIIVTPTYTNGGSSCPGTPASFSITVNPTPTVNNVASQVLCNGATSANVSFSGAVANTAYSWVNNNTSIGLAAAGTGDIAPFAAVNNGSAPVTATITVTPQATLSGRAYVPNNSSGTVSMIDLATGAVVGSPITVGANPFGVAVLPDRSKVYVSNTGGNSVSVISTTTNTVTGTSPYNAPHGLVASPDGTRVYVNGWTDNAVSWINAASNVSTFMTNVTQPEGMAVSADGARLYVASSTSPGKLVVINTASNAVVSNISVGNFPQGVTLSADGSKVYVVNNGSASVSVISSASNSVVATIPVGANPLGVAVSPDGSKLYVSNSGNNNVSVINTTTNALTASITVGSFPYGVAVSPDGSTVYVANRNSNNVSVINAATNAVSSVAVGTAPIALGQFTTASLQCAGTQKTFSFTVNPTATVNPVASQAVCNGAATTAVNFSGAVPGSTFAWTNSNTAIGLAASGSGNIPSFTATNTTSAPISATITVTPTYTNGGQSCAGTPVTFTITVNPSPSVNAVANQVLCTGSPTAAVNFSGPVSGSTYSWTNSNSSIGLAATGSGNIASFTAVNSSSTVQTATVTVTPSANGCAGIPATFTINVNPTPTADAIGNRTACAGTTVAAIDFSGPVTGTVFTWTNSNPSIGVPAGGTGSIGAFTATNSTSTVQTATITVTPSFTNAGQTCTGNPVTFTIIVQPTPTISAIPNQTVCNGASTTAVAFTGPVSGLSFTWTNNTPSIGLAASGTGTIPSFVATNSTASPVTATITVNPVANACPGTPQTYTITVNPTPAAAAVTSQSLCAGASTSAVAFSSAVAGATFAWTNNTPSIGLAATGSGNIGAFTAVNAGTAPVIATVTVTPSANGCSGSPQIFTYTVNPLPTGTITAPNGTLICQGSTLPLQVSGGTSYQWLLGGTPIAGATGASYNATQPGTYTVNITNAQGCTRAASNSISITLVQKPTAGFSFNSYCLNAPVTFSNSTGTAGAGTVNYQWNFGNGSTSTQASPTAIYNNVGTYTVQLIATPNGCPSLNDTIRKTIAIEAPLPGQRLATIDVVANRPTEIHARNLPNAHYSWTPTTGLSNPALWYPVATLGQEQEYRIQMSFNSGCITVDTLLVRVQKGDDIFVPTAFSPDGDGVNDVLRPITVGLSTFRSFHIYDRMGRELFASNQINQGWNGTLRGTALPAETYTWVVEGRDSNGQIIRKTGQVVLVR
ncbi:adventurous gliding motility protein AgmC [Flaviaesturariibacter terrae]